MKTMILCVMLAGAVAWAGDLDTNRKDALPSQALKMPPAMVWQGAIVHPSWVVLADDKRVVFGTSENRQVSVPYASIPANVQRQLEPQIRAALHARAAEVPAPTINGQVLQKVPAGILIVQGGLASDGQTVLLKGYPDEAKVVDKDAIRVYGTEAGTFQYQTLDGVMATVRVYQFAGDYKE